MRAKEKIPVCRSRENGIFAFYLLRFFSSRRLHFMVNGFLVMSFVRVPPQTRGLCAPLLPKGRGLGQDLHAIELLRARIGEWTITWMLDCWRVMCFTGYRLNLYSWIWILFPMIRIAHLLCSQVDRQDTASIAEAIIWYSTALVCLYTFSGITVDSAQYS